MKEQLEKQTAALLLEEGCVQFSIENPYTYASGLRGPIYCDNRLLISSISARQQVIQSFVSLLQEIIRRTEVIAGIATAGIPMAAWLAEAFQLPMIYVRGSAKAHGRKNVIEGKLQSGQKVLLIEDLINQGKSSFAALEEVESAGGKVIGISSIVDYEFSSSKELFKKINCPVFSLTNFSQLLEEGERSGKLRSPQLVSLKAWHSNPTHWTA